MAEKNIAVKHIQRNDTKANWLLSNPILSLGELGIETDTFKIKIGNGVDNYANLPYLNNSTVSKIATQKAVATVDGQAEFDIPFEDFESSNCYIDVRINSVWINPEKYTIEGKKLILNSGRKSGTEVFFTCHYLENHATNDGSVMKHTHTVSDITDFPTSLPANGGNASTATKLQTARTINGVSFDGSKNITVADSTKLPLTGGTITGNLYLKVGGVSTNVGTLLDTLKSSGGSESYDLTLVNGWASINLSTLEREYTVSVQKSGSVVTIEFTTLCDGETSYPVAYLPTGYRPSKKLLFTDGFGNRINISDDGTIECTVLNSMYWVSPITFVASN